MTAQCDHLLAGVTHTYMEISPGRFCLDCVALAVAEGRLSRARYGHVYYQVIEAAQQQKRRLLWSQLPRENVPAVERIKAGSAA